MRMYSIRAGTADVSHVFSIKAFIELIFKMIPFICYGMVSANRKNLQKNNPGDKQIDTWDPKMDDT